MNIHINTTLIDHVAQALFKHRLVNWVKSWVTGLFSNITATADATHSATPTVTPTYQNGVLTLAFSGLQGAGGSKWYSVNSTSVFNTAQAQSGVPTSGTTWKEGDYILNTYYGFIFKCTYLFAGGTLSNWSYEGCIKGADGQDGAYGAGITAAVVASDWDEQSWGDFITGHDEAPVTFASTYYTITRLRSDGMVKAGDTVVVQGKANDTEKVFVCMFEATSTNTTGGITAVAANGIELQRGQAGTNGTNGATWANGAAVSAATSSVPSGIVVGDYYLNSSTYDVWKCVSTTASTKWSLVCNIKGITESTENGHYLPSVVDKTIPVVTYAEDTFADGTIYTEKTVLQNLPIDSKKHIIDSEAEYTTEITQNYWGIGERLFSISWLVRYIEQTGNAGVIAIPFLRVASKPYLVKHFWKDTYQTQTAEYCPRYSDLFVEAFVLDDDKFIEYINDATNHGFESDYNLSENVRWMPNPMQYLENRYGINGGTITDSHKDVAEYIRLSRNNSGTGVPSGFTPPVCAANNSFAIFDSDYFYERVNEVEKKGLHHTGIFYNKEVTNGHDGTYSGRPWLRILDKGERFVELSTQRDTWMSDGFFPTGLTGRDGEYYNFGFCLIEDNTYINSKYDYNDLAEALIAAGRHYIENNASAIAAMGIPGVS